MRFDDRKWIWSKTSEYQICKHFVAQIWHQIDRHLRNSGILHDSNTLMDGWEWEKSKTREYSIFLANTLWLRLPIRSIDSHSMVILCMTTACRWWWVSTVANRCILSRHVEVGNVSRLKQTKQLLHHGLSISNTKPKRSHSLKCMQTVANMFL